MAPVFLIAGAAVLVLGILALISRRRSKLLGAVVVVIGAAILVLGFWNTGEGGTDTTPSNTGPTATLVSLPSR